MALTQPLSYPRTLDVCLQNAAKLIHTLDAHKACVTEEDFNAGVETALHFFAVLSSLSDAIPIKRLVLQSMLASLAFMAACEDPMPNMFPPSSEEKARGLFWAFPEEDSNHAK